MKRCEISEADVAKRSPARRSRTVDGGVRAHDALPFPPSSGGPNHGSVRRADLGGRILMRLMECGDQPMFCIPAAMPLTVVARTWNRASSGRSENRVPIRPWQRGASPGLSAASHPQQDVSSPSLGEKSKPLWSVRRSTIRGLAGNDDLKGSADSEETGPGPAAFRAPPIPGSCSWSLKAGSGAHRDERPSPAIPSRAPWNARRGYGAGRERIRPSAHSTGAGRPSVRIRAGWTHRSGSIRHP